MLVNSLLTFYSFLGQVYLFRYNRNFNPNDVFSDEGVPNGPFLKMPQLNIIRKDLMDAFSGSAKNFFKDELVLKERKFGGKEIENVWVITWLQMIQEREFPDEQVEEVRALKFFRVSINSNDYGERKFVRVIETFE